MDLERDDITSYIPRAFEAIDSAADTSAVDLSLLINNHVFKHGVTGNTVKNRFGGQTSVIPASTAFGTNDALQFTNSGYTAEGCTDVSRKINSVVYSMSVNGTDVKTGTTDLDTKALGTACNSIGNNTIVFVAARR